MSIERPISIQEAYLRAIGVFAGVVIFGVAVAALVFVIMVPVRPYEAESPGTQAELIRIETQLIKQTVLLTRLLEVEQENASRAKP